MSQRNRKRTQTNKKRNILIFIGLLIIVCLFLISEVMMISRTSKQKPQNKVTQENIVEEEKTLSEFNTFIDKVSTVEELDKLEDTQIIELYKTKSIENAINCENVAGSAKTSSNALSVVRNKMEAEGKVVNSNSVVEEGEVYYIVEVNYSLKIDKKKSYNTRYLVFKTEYYNSLNFNYYTDDIISLKYVLDLDNYIKYSSNPGKKLIQSFIKEDDTSVTYTIYYMDVTYSQENSNDSIQMIKETKVIDKTSKRIVNTEKSEISNQISV